MCGGNKVFSVHYYSYCALHKLSVDGAHKKRLALAKLIIALPEAW